MIMVEFIFGCVGCAATVIGGCVAAQSWRKRRRAAQAAERADRATREAFAQVGASAEWLRDSYRRQSHGEAQSRPAPDAPAPTAPTLFLRTVVWLSICLAALSWLALPFLILAMRDWTLISIPLIFTVAAATGWIRR